MAKKKNTLKDLDAFLKQEAKSFVNPSKVESKAPTPETQVTQEEIQANQISHDQVVKYISKLEKDELYQLIQQALEDKNVSSAKDKMLINTLLYLKDQDNWRENIKNYWA